MTLKSGLGVVQSHLNGTVQNLRYGFLFAFHSNYGGIFSRFNTIHESDGQTPHDGIGRAYTCIARQERQSVKGYAMYTHSLVPKITVKCVVRYELLGFA